MPFRIVPKYMARIAPLSAVMMLVCALIVCHASTSVVLITMTTHPLTASPSKPVKLEQLHAILDKQGCRPTCTGTSYVYIPSDTLSDCIYYQRTSDLKACELPAFCGHKFIRNAGPLSPQPYICYGVGLDVPRRRLDNRLMSLAHLYPIQFCHWKPCTSQWIQPTLAPQCVQAKIHSPVALPSYYRADVDGTPYYIPPTLIDQYVLVTYSSTGYVVTEGSNAITTDDRQTCYYTMALADFMYLSFQYRFTVPHYFYYSNFTSLSVIHQDIRYAEACLKFIVNMFEPTYHPHEVFLSSTRVVTTSNVISDGDIRFYQWCYPGLVGPPSDSFTYSIYKGLVFLASFVWDRLGVLFKYVLYSLFGVIVRANSSFLLFEYVVAYIVLRQYFTTDVSLLFMFFAGVIFGVYRELEPQILSLPPGGCSYRGHPPINPISVSSPYC